MSETPIVTFSSLDNPNTWGVEGESKRLVFASPSEAKRAEELFTAMQRALTAERERADRNQEDAERWIRLCELWCASTELALMQEDDGRWSIKQVEDVEGETFYQLFGDTPDAAIDAARRK